MVNGVWSFFQSEFDKFIGTFSSRVKPQQKLVDAEDGLGNLGTSLELRRIRVGVSVCTCILARNCALVRRWLRVEGARRCRGA